MKTFFLTSRPVVGFMMGVAAFFSVFLDHPILVFVLKKNSMDFLQPGFQEWNNHFFCSGN